MKYPLTLLSMTACLCLTNLSATKAQAVRRSKTPLNSSRSLNSGERQAADQALARLRVLRDGWNDVNRQFIKQNFVAARRLDSREYEVQYLEAKTAVADALQVLPKGELRTAIDQAMDIFDDLEAITEIFRKNSPITTNVRVTDVFPYLKKYNVPYESGVTKASYGLMLHQDFLMSYILPVRYERVNRVEVLLGGERQSSPPPPTYEQMFRVPKIVPALDHSNVNAEELKGITRQLIEAKLRGETDRVSVLLDDSFMYHGRGGRQGDKAWFLRSLKLDPTVKSFEIDQAELSFRNELPVLSTTVRYESPSRESKSFNNTFTFVSRGGKWLVSKWSSL